MDHPSQRNASGQTGGKGQATTGPDDLAIRFFKTIQSLTERNMLLARFGEAHRQAAERIDARLEAMRVAGPWDYDDRSQCESLLNERETAVAQCLNMLDLQQELATELKTYERDIATQEQSGASEFSAGMLSRCMQEAVSLRSSIEWLGKGYRPILETEAEKTESWRSQLREMTGGEPERTPPPAKKFLPN